jgi:hypothetical protein
MRCVKLLSAGASSYWVVYEADVNSFSAVVARLVST